MMELKARTESEVDALRDEEKRWSHQYKGKGEGLDNIIISPALADGEGIEYVRGSFGRFDGPYLAQRIAQLIQ